MDYIVENNISLAKDYPYISKKNPECYKFYKVVPKQDENPGRRLQQFRPGMPPLGSFGF